MTTREYLKQLGLDDTATAALGAKLDEPIYTKGDLNSVTARATQAEQKRLEWENWAAEAVPEYNAMAAEWEKLKNGNPNPANPAPTRSVDPNDQPLTRKQVNELFQEFGSRTDKVVTGLARVTAGHVIRYKEEPDIDAIRELAVKNGGDVQKAYDTWVEPKRVAAEATRKTADEEALKARIAKEREDAVREYASTHKLPIDPGPGVIESSPIFAHPAVTKDSTANTNGFKPVTDEQLMETWNASLSASAARN